MSKAAKQKAKALEDQKRAIKLRADGMNYFEIADTMGCSISSAQRRVVKGMALLRGEVVEEARDLRDMQGAQIDRWLTRIEGAALVPKIKSRPMELARLSDSAGKLLARKAKLFGLDMPAKIEVKDVTVDWDARVAKLGDFEKGTPERAAYHARLVAGLEALKKTGAAEAEKVWGEE